MRVNGIYASVFLARGFFNKSLHSQTPSTDYLRKNRVTMPSMSCCSNKKPSWPCIDLITCISALGNMRWRRCWSLKGYRTSESTPMTQPGCVSRFKAVATPPRPAQDGNETAKSRVFNIWKTDKE